MAWRDVYQPYGCAFTQTYGDPHSPCPHCGRHIPYADMLLLHLCRSVGNYDTLVVCEHVLYKPTSVLHVYILHEHIYT